MKETKINFLDKAINNKDQQINQIKANIKLLKEKLKIAEKDRDFLYKKYQKNYIANVVKKI